LHSKDLNKVEKLFLDSIKIKKSIVKDHLFTSLVRMGKIASESITNRGKILLCGNGGSAADAQHLAAEMLVRLRPNYNREGIPAIALAQDTSTITACGNDFGFDNLYERMVLSLGKKGDVLIVITTSGNSKNIILAMHAAKVMGIKVFAFLGSGGGEAIDLSDEYFLVPSYDTGRIQESHITAGHALMECIEDQLLECNYIHLKAD
jgi:D-sedoheptulose 7-phosphate isomerase